MAAHFQFPSESSSWYAHYVCNRKLKISHGWPQTMLFIEIFSAQSAFWVMLHCPSMQYRILGKACCMAIKYLAVHSSVSIESLRASRHAEPDTPSLISKIPGASLQFICKGFTCGTHWNFQKYPKILQDFFLMS